MFETGIIAVQFSLFILLILIDVFKFPFDRVVPLYPVLLCATWAMLFFGTELFAKKSVENG